MEKKENKALINLLSFIMGVINGLFGAGGGMLAVVLLERCKKLSAQKAHASALLIMLPLTLISFAVYVLRKAVDMNGIILVTIGMLPGSVIGAKLLGKINNRWINRIFCILMLLAGARMLMG